MKPLLTAIAAALFLLLSVPARAAYIIHLHDGTQFVTDQYFEEGDQIKFKRYGGLIGIEKDRIREIEETDDLPEEQKVLVDQGRTKATEVKLKESEGMQSCEEQKSPTENTEYKEEGRNEAKSAKGKELEHRDEHKDDVVIIEETNPDEAFKKRKLDLIRKLKEALQSYRRAKVSRLQSLIDDEFRRASEISAELSQLEKEVKSRHGGILPPWWDETEFTK